MAVVAAVAGTAIAASPDASQARVCKVVDVRGKNAFQAEQALNAAGCRGRWRMGIDCAPTRYWFGRVMRQRPTSGILPPGRTILLVKGVYDVKGCTTAPGGGGGGGGSTTTYDGNWQGTFDARPVIRLTLKFTIANGSITGDLVGTISPATKSAKVSVPLSSYAAAGVPISCPATEIVFTSSTTVEMRPGATLTCSYQRLSATGRITAARL